MKKEFALKMHEWAEKNIKESPRGYTLKTATNDLLHAGQQAKTITKVGEYMDLDYAPYTAMKPAMLLDNIDDFYITEDRLKELLKADEKEFTAFMLGDVNFIPNFAKDEDGLSGYIKKAMPIVKGYMHLQNLAIWTNPRTVTKNKVFRTSKPQGKEALRRLALSDDWVGIGAYHFMYIVEDTTTKIVYEHTPLPEAYLNKNPAMRVLVSGAKVYSKRYVSEALDAFVNMRPNDWKLWNKTMTKDRYAEGDYKDEEDFLT